MRHKAGRGDSGMKSARQGRLARSTLRIQCKKEKLPARQAEGRSRKDEDLMVRVVPEEELSS